MAADKFRHAEDEYFKLRGQFDTGRLTQDQFDEKLRELMQQDAQGRYWMLGADSAKWYFYDGAKWVQSDPYEGKVPPGNTPPETVPPLTSKLPPATASPASSPSPRPIPDTAAVTPIARSGNRGGLPIVPILIVLLLLILGVIAFLVYQNRDRLFVAQAPNQITPVLPPTITRAPSPTALSALPTQTLVQPTLAPLATAVLTATPAELPTLITPTEAPTSIPATSAPAVTIIVVTAQPPTTTVQPTGTAALPTLLPGATVPPTAGIPTATKLPATATNAPPTATTLPPCPTGVCVTQIVYAPDQPKRNQDITFTATFLNSTGGTSYYNWVIFSYRQGQSKRFGESSPHGISIPAGVSTFSLPYTMVKGPGGCEDFYAHAGWKVSSVEDHEFPSTSGDPATVSLSVCP